MPSPSYIPVIATGRPLDAAAVTTSGKLLGADWMPADHGFETWTHDPGGPASSVSGVNGTVYVVRMPVRRAYTCAAVWWGVVVNGVTPVAGQNWVGLYDWTGVRLGQVNTDAAVTSTGGKRSVIAAPVSGPFVWAAFLVNATTNPTLLRGSSFESTPSINLPTVGLRAAVAGTGATALPASFDPNTLTTSNCLTFFAAIESA